jgi:hypothetical protein
MIRQNFYLLRFLFSVIITSIAQLIERWIGGCQTSYSAARLVTSANRFASSKVLLKSLHWIPVRARIQYKIAVLVYRCINGCAPSYLRDLVTRYVPARALRSSHSNDLCVPKIKCNRYGRRSFMSAAPSVWNPLPLSLKLSPDLNTFCAELKTQLFRLYNQPS